ncbi:hypothetical protein BIT28_25780 [Photobacterium proteolyticum]|uniref:Uncharacterized protein n=1 Tax=Photobacterium proteolyticum TaxID=1903952 RepID=A0A1Q9H1R2_9GAMM|nr:hypothetical protein [Photobacterium proteolyticum]OLQ81660.1 hypothetical protein BIT28_25780 [Photobacterium proteolyticum]
MKNPVSRSVVLTPQQAMRVAHCLCNYYSIPALGDQFVALIGEGYEYQNVTAMKNWVQKQANKVRNKSDISEWAALLRSDLESFGIELMD